MRLRILLLAAALLTGCLGSDPASPATGDDPAAPDEPPSENRHEDLWNLSPRTGRELNFEMAEGGSIRFLLNASAEVVWDVHSHEEDHSTIVHHEGRGRLAEGTFTAPADDVYSIFARGNGSSAVVRVLVEGAFRIRE